MTDRLVFMKRLDDSKWGCVLVGNVINGQGEVLDAGIFATEDEADAWRAMKLGPSKIIYKELT